MEESIMDGFTGLRIDPNLGHPGYPGCKQWIPSELISHEWIEANYVLPVLPHEKRGDRFNIL
ncbi:hypothetical protein GCM10023197_45890 [Gordonia humi]